MKKYRPSTRRLIQVYAGLMHNAYLKGFVTGDIYKGAAKYACAPGLNCYSCPGAAFSCPLGALQNALAASGHRAPWYILGILLLFGVTLGRTVCGFLCPMGLLQEVLHKIPTPKVKKSHLTRLLSLIKYGILAVFVIALPLWYALKDSLAVPAFCKYICPAGTLEGAVGTLANPANTSMFAMLGAFFTRKWVILILTGLGCVFLYRGFCRFLCPLGAIYGLFNRVSLVGVRVEEAKCVSCGACTAACGMDIKRVGDRECIHCGQCVSACAQGAIALKAGTITLKGPDIEKEQAGQIKKRPHNKKILWGAALIVLCLVLIWFNFLDPASQTSAADPAFEQVSDESVPMGHEVGEMLPDFELPLYDGTVFHLADTRGKVVMINLWATYCAPCKKELPYFNDLLKAHGEDLAVLAVHPSLVTEDPEEYLSGLGYLMAFGTDTPEDTVVTIVGGADTLPRTVVLDRQGVVVYNAPGSVTMEMLEALAAQAAGD